MTGSNFDAFIQMDDVVVNGQPKQVPLANSPNPLGGGRVMLAKSRSRAVDRPQRRRREQDLRGLALRRGLQPRRDPRRPLPDQGQRGDLDRWSRPRPFPSTPTTPLVTAVPTNDPTQPNYDVTSSPTFPQGNYNDQPRRRSEQPQHRLPRRHLRRPELGPDPHRHHRHLRFARLRRLRQQSPRRRQARDQYRRPDPGDQLHEQWPAGRVHDRPASIST